MKELCRISEIRSFVYCLDSASFVVCSDLGPTHYVLLEKGKKQHVRPIGTANKVSSVYTHFL